MSNMINFKELRMKNFLPYGDTQVLKINPGINIILGKNGYGKSSIISALNYVLFGNDYGKKKVNNLINKYRKKEMLVELELEYKGDNYLIRRGKKPDIFEIYKNGELISQDSKVKDYQKRLEEMLNINENIFKQLIALGANVAGVKHFMDLSTKEKEEVLQIMLDTKLFSVLSQLVNEEKKILKNKLANLESERKIIEKNLEQNKKVLQDIEIQNKELLENKDKEISKIEKELEEIAEKVKELEEKLVKKPKVEEKLAKLENQESELVDKINKAKRAKVKIETTLKNIENSEIIKCPECGSEINLVKQKINKDEDELKSHLKEVEEKIIAYTEEYEKILTEKKKFEKAYKVLEDLTKELYNLKSKGKYLTNKLNDLSKQKVVSTEEIEKLIKELEDRQKEIDEKIEKLNIEINDYTQIEKLLKNDSLKGIIIEKKLPLLNKYINEYLEKFEVDFQFFITPTLKETIKRRDENFEYHNLSNGEKQRIVLSILFAFLRLLEHNVKINVLFLDEFLDSALDDDGSQAVINILENEFNNKAVFIITHKQEIKEIDGKIIQLKKDKHNKFSIIEQA